MSSPPSFSSRTHLKNTLSSSSVSSTSVLMHHEQAAPAVTSVLTTSVARHFPTSVLLQEQRDEYRPLLHMFKEDKAFQATIDRRQMATETPVLEEQNSCDMDQLVQDFQHQLLHWPGLWNMLSPIQTAENPSLSLAKQSVINYSKDPMDIESFNIVALAKKALSASKEAASLVANSEIYRADVDDTFSASSSNFPLDEVKTVRSTRLLERRSKKRRASESKVMVHETYSSRKAEVRKKLNEGFDPNSALRLFLSGPETRQLLTVKEECELVAKIQDLMKLEKVKGELQSQFGREPTLLEWAEAVGISCQVLQSELHAGNSSREKLINANLRLVVHVAKQYQGRGLHLQDLLQFLPQRVLRALRIKGLGLLGQGGLFHDEGSMGLMKSVEKYKPQAGCRFASYAYWWIRQKVRKAIFHHSRTIRLPETVYTRLSKVLEAKRLYIQEGNRNPTNEELAKRVGITVGKLEKLLCMTRLPISMQQTVWADQDTTYQEITADTKIEIPDISVAKQLMRQHTRNLLSILSPKERHIIKLRFGIEDGTQKSLAEIAKIYGLSKERVRQLESRALYRLKQSFGSEAIGGYADLLAIQSRFEMTCSRYFKFRLFLVILLCSSVSYAAEASQFQELMAFKSGLTNAEGIADWGREPSPCSWTGITCRNGSVVALSLPHLGLKGWLRSLPLTSLSNLELLDLTDNAFSGPIPSLFWKLKKLKTLDLSFNFLNGSLSSDVQNLRDLINMNLAFNRFSGRLTPAISACSSLRTLILNSNMFTGQISEQLSQLSKLQVLDLGGNAFSGPIPSTIGSLSGLQVLDLSNGFLSGSIPISTGQLARMQTFDISNNSITGPIPSSIAGIAALRYLLIGHNRFFSSLPREIGNLTDLLNLEAPSCNLKGPIPDEIGNLRNLKKLDLSGNQLQSPIPPAIGKLLNLTYLFISNAEINGTIPSELGNCQKLKTAVLSFNDLSGALPNGLANLSESMISFSIENNQIGGEIPTWFGKWLFAESILLASNQFRGRIPAEIGNCSSLAYLSLSHNHLSGIIPSELCGCKFLSDLELNNNYLVGSIGGTFRNCRNLSQLILSQNQLIGTVPAYLSHLPLLSLELDYNNFSGQIPQEIWSSRTLLEFSASYNFLDGQLSAKIGNSVTIQRLTLDHNRLEGRIPKEIRNLEGLLVLSLNQNMLSGEIPHELFTLRFLTTLDLGYNNFTGSIPANIWELKELEYLVLAHNQLSGPLPMGITEGFRQPLIPDTSYLQHRGILDLSMNKLSGQIPEQLGNCSVIVNLLLANNNFTGNIPGSIFQLPNLVSIDISSNTLEGKIPNEVGDAKKLQGLKLACNHLSGQIPSEIGKLQHLVKLNLSGNQLTGEIPLSTGHLQSLSYLDLSNNHLSGEIPFSLSKLTNIVGLSLQENKLSGNLSKLLRESSSWHLIGTLNLSLNRLNGEIPSSIASLSYLTSLDLRSNRLSGTITGYLSNLSQLQYLDISENFFHGPIPPELCDLTELRFLNLSSNLLQGQVLECTKFKANSSWNNGDNFESSAKDNCKNRIRWKCYLLEIPLLLILSLSTTLSVMCLFLLFLKRRTLKAGGLKPLSESLGNRDLNEARATMFKHSSLQLAFSDIVRITNNFCKSNAIGDGGSGTVYKGILPSGQLVAVKKLDKARDQGSKEFLAEMEATRRLKHSNLISLLGSCSFRSEKLLIYEFMVNGSLDFWLRNKPGPMEALVGDIRFKIVLGTARGLAFLHHTVDPPIIHRDVKASNILLDHDFEPRIADFGLARTLNVSETHVTTEIAGTSGYIAPEYGQSWRSTTKGDVYSFGVLMLEIVTGKEPTGSEFKDLEGGNLVGWVREMIEKGKGIECLDGKISNESIATAKMLKLLHMGLHCTQDDPFKRPTMQEVVQCLEYIAMNN
ncbi:hypothetical protein JRO89_XS12G0027100 [Xanthoceras sorbifolium]|uniref:Protein kinase domain-containing protein n=1 Tax=Xanthoceras sorbifolium TaxID=99658 RepID=A0ABQ8HAN4_9ROSI|nr:hypothetical protein JRO89_XS12G0027100 [Xanthoceras sorbifolium]